MRCLRYLALAAALVYLAWFGAPENRAFGGYGGVTSRGDYYNLLTEGFLNGHTWMNLPEVPAGQAPSGYNDASFYRGHYYIDFGPAPVLLFLLPYKVLTGNEAPLALPILLSIGIGALLQGAILADARRRYFPQLCPWFEALLWLLIAFGSTCPLLLAVGNVYEVAVAVGYLCVSATWFAFYRALHAGKGRVGWLILASTAAGFSVASRPSMLFLYPALAAGAVWLMARLKTPAERWAVAAASVVPSALAGLGLLTYNFVRFGRATEMGLSFQNNPLNQSHAALMSARFIWANLRWYYLRPPQLTPYFPFVLPMDTHDAPAHYGGVEWIHGQLALLLAAVVVVAAALLGRARKERLEPPLKAFVGILCLAGVLVLAFLCCAGVRADRYQVDCQGSLVLAVALLAGWTAAPLGWKGRALPALMVLLVAAYNVLTPYAFVDALFERLSRALPGIERTLNLPSYWAYRAGLVHYGPRRLTLRFPGQARSLVEPLVSAGSTLGEDTLESVRLAPDLEQFIFDCGERGSFKSRPMPVVAERAYAVDVDMGAFYPPRHHPFFDGWDPKAIERVKTTARVAVDGREWIHTRLPFADSAPDAIGYGQGPLSGQPVFSGTIVSNVRLPMRDLVNDPALVEQGVWKVSLEPLFKPNRLQMPIIAAGQHGAGVLLLTATEGGRRMSLGLDVWGLQVTYSAPFEVTEGYHTLLVLEGHQVLATHPDLAARLPAAKKIAFADRLFVWWDGRLAWQTPIRSFGDTFDMVALGANPQQFSSTGAIYAGAFYPEPVTPGEIDAAVQAALAAIR